MQDTKKVQTLIKAAAESIIAARNISNILWLVVLSLIAINRVLQCIKHKKIKEHFTKKD